jgi:hypothetical protein
MKKLIAIGVVFVLVVGTAFAAVEVSVDVAAIIIVAESTSKKILSGTDALGNPTYKDDTVRTGGQAHTAQIGASAQNESGTIGGTFKLKANGYTNTQGYGPGAAYSAANGGANAYAWGWVWWKPVDVIRLQFGTNAGDGEFEAPSSVAQWGFYQGDDVQITANGAWGNLYGFGINTRDAFYGGYNNGGLVLKIGSFNGFSINVGIPFWSGVGWGSLSNTTNVGTTNKTLENTLKHIEAQIRYDIDNVGVVTLTVVGNDATPSNGSASDELKLFLNFDVSAIPNIGLAFGVGYQLPDLNYIATSTSTVSTYNPLFVGLAANVNADKFGLKFRAVMALGGNKKTENNDGTSAATEVDPTPFKLQMDLMPTYQLSDSATVKVSFGIGILGEDLRADGTVANDMAFGWHVNPYLVLSGAGGGSFFIGFRLEGRDAWKDDRGDKYILWSLPMALKFSF